MNGMAQDYAGVTAVHPSIPQGERLFSQYFMLK
jgi:hypothetical protein